MIWRGTEGFSEPLSEPLLRLGTGGRESREILLVSFWCAGSFSEGRPLASVIVYVAAGGMSCEGLSRRGVNERRPFKGVSEWIGLSIEYIL